MVLLQDRRIRCNDRLHVVTNCFIRWFHKYAYTPRIPWGVNGTALRSYQFIDHNIHFKSDTTDLSHPYLVSYSLTTPYTCKPSLLRVGMFPNWG